MDETKERLAIAKQLNGIAKQLNGINNKLLGINETIRGVSRAIWLVFLIIPTAVAFYLALMWFG